MKTLIIFSLIAFFFTGITISQTQSNLTFDAGTNIIVQAGADICADTIIFNGTYTITGTVCGHPIGINPIASEIPNSYNLYQNYPNPFNPVTKIKFDLPKSNSILSGVKGHFIRLAIYNIQGKELIAIVSQQLDAGAYEVQWDGTDYPGGVYFYKLTAGDYSETRKMVLIK